MFSNRLALTTLAAACVAAAGVGGYLAARHNVTAVDTLKAESATTTVAPEALTAVQPQAALPATNNPGGTLSTPAAAPKTPMASTSAAKASPSSSKPAAVRREAEPSAHRETDQPADLDRNGSNSSSSPASSASSAAVTETQTAGGRIDEHPAEPPRAPEPPARTFEELVVAADSVIGLQTETTLSSDHSRVEDRVDARVVRDVRVNGRVAIPAGTRALGSVVVVERGGKFKERARIGIRFQTILMADGTRVPISTETIYRYGDAPGNASAAKIGGGAAIGAIVGGIIGGGKGAAIGATTGAGAGTASVMAGDRNVAAFPAGAQVTARIVSPVTVTIQQD